MRKAAQTRRFSVCLISAHPLVLAEFQRLLSRQDFRLSVTRLGSTLPSDLGHLEVPGIPLLGLGVKGLLTYQRASEELPRAIRAVAEGGFWVPRSLLSRFVDGVLKDLRSRRPGTSTAALTPREQEVLD